MSKTSENNFLKSYLKSTYKIGLNTNKATHTWMQRPGLTLHIPDGKLEDFFDKYFQFVFDNNERSYLTEIPDIVGRNLEGNLSPIRVRLD